MVLLRSQDSDMSINNKHKRSNGIRELPWGVCIFLLDGPLTMEQIQTSYRNNPFPSSQQSGSYKKGMRHTRRLERLSDDLARLIKAGWVIQDGDQFALTTLGREQVNQAMDKAQSSLKWVSHKLRSFVQPEVASKVTLIVQVILALIKLPAGLLSGSIGLLNDSLDTILDLLSSLLVYLGIRFNKERLVSILLVVFMLGTGGFTLYEAMQRFFTPYVPKVDWFPFAAALLSAVAGLLLWTYQRYVGIHSGLMAFITESVDSRNHVIVALGVTAGLIASLLQFGLLDMLVGLAVAILILWSAIELVVDLARSSADGHVDLSRYGFWLQDVYEHARAAYLADWMLYLVDRQEARTRGELVDRVRQAFDFRDNPWMQAIGLDRQMATDSIIEQSLDELFSRGWIVDQDPLIISPEGKEHLKRQTKRRRKRW
jgi:Co/Zn/Cd efflux system component